MSVTQPFLIFRKAKRQVCLHYEECSGGSFRCQGGKYDHYTHFREYAAIEMKYSQIAYHFS